MSNLNNRGALSVNEFAIWAAIGRTTAWKEIKEGRLHPVKVCARTIVPMEEAERWLRACRPTLPCTAATVIEMAL